MKALKQIAVFALTFLAAYIVTGNACIASLISGAAVTAMTCIHLPSTALGVYVGATPMAGEDGSVAVITSERERATYEHNKVQARFAGKNMTQGYLRLEATITGNNNKLSFKTYDGDGTSVYPTERRLDRNDAFIADKVAIFLLKQDIANRKTNGRLHTYPNVTEFGATAAADLESIYNGELSVTIGRVKKLVGFDLRRMLYVPQTLQSAAGNRDSYCGQKGGFAKLTPQLVLDGSGTNEIEINYPTFAGWAGYSAVAGTEHRIVLIFRGLLVTDGSQNS